MSVSTDQPTGAPASGAPALAILRQFPGAAFVLDRELRIVLVAGGGLAHHGVDADVPQGRHAASVIDPDRWAIYEPLCQAALLGECQTAEVWSSDETHCYLLQIEPWSDGDAQIVGVLAMAHDITQRKHSDEARRHAQERFELVFDQSPVGMALLTPDGRPVRVNEALLAMTGYSSQQLLSKTLDELTDPDDIHADQEQLRRLRAGEIDSYQVDKRYLHARGHLVSVVQSVSLVRDRPGRPLHLIAQIQDMTEHRQIERRLGQLTERDQLTGLLSRRRMEQELLARTIDGRGVGSTLIVIDLDDFRRVNDTYGHRVGDELLRQIAAELRRRLRGGDLIARMGGDEFAILLPDTEPDAAGSVTRDLTEVIAQCTVDAAGNAVGCTASVGVSGPARERGDGEALISAERAMRAVKLEHRGDASGVPAGTPGSA